MTRSGELWASACCPSHITVGLARGAPCTERAGADRAHPRVPIKACCSCLVCTELERPFFLLRSNSSGATDPTRASRVLVIHSFIQLRPSTFFSIALERPW